jgi:hypothetical protein
VRGLLIVLVSLALPAIAVAKPKVAIAPLESDNDGGVAELVAKEAAAHAKVTSAKATAKAIEELNISDPGTSKALKKLRNKLEVDAVIHGKVDRDGGKKKLVLAVSGRGKAGTPFEIEYKSLSSKTFHKELRDALAKKIAGLSESDHEDDSGDDAEEHPVKHTFSDDHATKHESSDDHPTKHESSDDHPTKHESSDDHPSKHESSDDHPKRVASDDSGHVRKHSDDGEDHPRKRKHRRSDDDDTPARHPVTQAALWLDGGAAGMHRTLTYDTSGGAASPPRAVGTGSLSAQIEGEVYPGSFDTLKGAAANLGLVGAFGKTVGLAIHVPGTTASASINEGHYEIGARYRVISGTSAFAFGVSYWERRFIADRSGMGAMLDMPDVEYKGVAPAASAKFAATPKVGIGLSLELPLMLASGTITSGTSFGQASILAFAGTGSVDVLLGPHYGLRFAALFDQVGLSFKAATPTRGVSGATDRSMGVTATLSVVY